MNRKKAISQTSISGAISYNMLDGKLLHHVLINYKASTN